uniref:retention module-containing protein n=1 Tax=Zoogloea sp. TaxID=49181 RepID=UPI0035AFED84
MASPTPTPNATINPATQGTVAFVQGEAYMRDRQGKLIAIKPGDAVVEGQEIVTAAGAVVELQLPSGARLSIGADRQVLLNDELFATATPDPSEYIVSSLGADADRVIQALNAGRDPFADLEEPAAGLTAGANGDQTHDFVRLVRILEDVTPLAFEYSSSTDGIDFRPVSGATALPTTTPLPANRPPVASDDTGASTLAGQAVRVNVLDNDSDPDGDPLTVTDASVDPAQGRVFVNADGTLTFTPADNFGGTAQITYTISDGKGGTSSAAASVAVTPANTPAQLSSARASVQEDSVLSAAGTLTISDPDAGEATFQPQTHIAGSYGHFSIDATGAWSYTLDNASPAVQALKDGPPQTETFTVYSADGTATTVTIDVFGKDEPANTPAQLSSARASVQEDSVLSAAGTLTISDPDAGEATFQPQ